MADMTEIPFVREIAFEYGRIDRLSPHLRRLIAPNAGPYTYVGTSTYIVGEGEVAVVDPGPADAAHIETLLEGLGAERVTAILVTHTHQDHSPGAALLKQRTGAPTYGFGPHGAGKSAEGVKIEAGGDMAFVPDVALGDGDRYIGRGFSLEAVYTPGHTSNHLCFALAEDAALLCGDHVMAWATSVIAPPDGDMADYVASLKRLLGRDETIYWPGHGPAVMDPKPFVRAYIAHRGMRARAILATLDGGPKTIPEIVSVVYGGIDPALFGAAGLSTRANLDWLVRDGKVAVEAGGEGGERYALAGAI